MNAKDQMLSFRCDDYIVELLEAKHARAQVRMRRFQLHALKNGRRDGSFSSGPSFSAWMRREIMVALRRFENDIYVGGNFRRAMSFLLNPSSSDFARVVLSFSVDPSWNGFLNMDSYKRMKKLRQVAAKASSGLGPCLMAR